jgi:hypothetical protein
MAMQWCPSISFEKEWGLIEVIMQNRTIYKKEYNIVTGGRYVTVWLMDVVDPCWEFLGP